MASKKVVLPAAIRTRKGSLPIVYKTYQPYGHRKDGRPRSLYGETDRETIWVNKEQRLRTMLGTIAHEYLHCAFPEASERQVLRMERACRDVLDTILEDNGLLPKRPAR